MGLRLAVRRLFAKRGSDGHSPAAKERHRTSEGFFEERAKALGPDAYVHVDVDREFRRP
jgi:hypothetical protein